MYWYEEKPLLSQAARKALGMVGAGLLVGLMWTAPAWLMVLGVI